MASIPAADRVTWEPGGQVGPYRLVERLARGGMAELFVATHEDDPRQVVIKRVHDHLRADPGFDAMFVRETRIAASLRHRNIVQVLATNEANGSPYLVMELLDGLDVSSILRRLRRHDRLLPIGDGIRIAIEAAHGLAYAHDKCDEDGTELGIVHRDVSPSNLFVTREGEVKLLDFGIAKTTNATQITGAGVRKGKGSYMAPEQVLGGVVDRRSDVFALGAVLFELTTLRRAFDGDNDLAVLHAITTRSVEPPSSIVEDYPPALEQIVLTAMQRDPDERWSTTAEMAEALEELSSRPGLASSPKRLSKLVSGLVTEIADPPKAAPTVDLTPPPFGVGDRSDGALLLPTPTNMEDIVGEDSGRMTVSDAGSRPQSSVPPPDSGPIAVTSPEAPATEVTPARARTVVAERAGATVVSNASASAGRHAPIEADVDDFSPSRKLPLVAGLASLAGAAALAWVYLVDPASTPDATTPGTGAVKAAAVDSSEAEARTPSMPGADPVASPDPESDLARLNDRAQASTLSFSQRHEALRRVSAAGLDARVDTTLQLFLDVAQATDATAPCTTFRGALRSLAAADHAAYVDDLAEVAVPTAPGADEGPGACVELDALLASVVEPKGEASPAPSKPKTPRPKTPRPKTPRPAKPSKPTEPAEPVPSDVPDDPPPKPTQPSTKLDDELRPFGGK